MSQQAIGEVTRHKLPVAACHVGLGPGTAVDQKVLIADL